MMTAKGCPTGGQPMENDDDFAAKYPRLKCGLCGFEFASDAPMVPTHRPEQSTAAVILSLGDEQSKPPPSELN